MNDSKGLSRTPGVLAQTGYPLTAPDGMVARSRQREGAKRGGTLAHAKSRRDRIETESQGMAQRARTAIAAKTADQAAPPIAALKARIEALSAELRGALEQQTATAEILQVINSSPGDLAPVFEAMLDKAMRLCDAAFGVFETYDGEFFRATALRGVPPALAEFLRKPFRAGRGYATRQLADGAAIVHIADVTAHEAGSGAGTRAVSELGGGRTVVWVALRKEEALLGFIGMYRQEVRAFSDKEITLLQNFAAQAVIAMENARLLTEQREALERQTATAEILRVISSSPTDVQPTFDAIARAATELSGATNGGVFRFDGGLIHFVAHHGWTPDTLAAIRGVFPLPPGRGSITARAILTRQVAHVADMAADPEFEHLSLTEGGLHTTLSVPMLRDGNPIGAITVTRREVELFSDRQIDLLKTFADQAVIAVENVRLFNELNERTGDLEESLEYQTATSDVLKVISRSTFDLQPVLDTLCDAAARLCEPDVTGIAIRTGATYHYVAFSAATPEWEAWLRGRSFTPDQGTFTGRALLERRVVHVADIADDPAHAVPEIMMVGNIRTVLAVPLLREGEPIGVLGLARCRVEPFSERQVALVSTFADQAVIAIENTRLITETREALEQQTATAEVLQVINSSPGDLAPVFDAMLEKAMRLCEAAYGVIRTYDGQLFHEVARRDDADVVDRLRDFSGQGRGSGPIQPGPNNPLGRLVQGERVVHIADLATEADQQDAANRERIAVTGARTWLAIALQKEGLLLGAIIVHRREVLPFTDKQIALLESFAAQAVIAMENARLLTEQREALERQTATAEILRVISSSPTDVQPTFDAIAAAATTLSGATAGGVFRFDGSLIHFVAHHGWTAAELDAVHGVFPLPPGRGSITARAILTRAVAHVADMTVDPEFEHMSLAQDGLHTMLAVPMLRDGDPIGAIVVQRRHVELFSDKQIDLLKTFADQAVIAIENVRLFNELNERTGDLQESLDYQTATSDVLKVISRSTFESATGAGERGRHGCPAVPRRSGNHLPPPGWRISVGCRAFAGARIRANRARGQDPTRQRHSDRARRAQPRHGPYPRLLDRSAL